MITILAIFAILASLILSELYLVYTNYRQELKK